MKRRIILLINPWTYDFAAYDLMMTYWYPAVFDIITIVRTMFPGVPVVLGGNYVTLCPRHASRSGADFCLPGPAEASIPALLKDLFNHEMIFLPDNNDLDLWRRTFC